MAVHVEVLVVEDDPGLRRSMVESLEVLAHARDVQRSSGSAGHRLCRHERGRAPHRPAVGAGQAFDLDTLGKAVSAELRNTLLRPQ
jgi:hypothetical protein